MNGSNEDLYIQEVFDALVKVANDLLQRKGYRMNVSLVCHSNHKSDFDGTISDTTVVRRVSSGHSEVELYCSIDEESKSIMRSVTAFSQEFLLL